MRICNLINKNGNPAPNQFVINDKGSELFQSYKTKIAKVKDGSIVLDIQALNYSNTTSKHLFIFLGMNRKQIESQIESGAIKLEDLNK